MKRSLNIFFIAGLFVPSMAGAQLFAPYIRGYAINTADSLDSLSTVYGNSQTGVDKSSGTASASGYPTGNVSATANTNAYTGYYSGESSVTMTYYVGITGPSGIRVPIDFVSSAFASGSTVGTEGGAGVFSYANLIVASDDLDVDQVNYTDQFNLNTNGGATSDNFQSLTKIDAYAGDSDTGAITVKLTAYSISSANGPDNTVANSAQGEASVDPYFYIDPSFALASEFTLSFSQGISNQALATPEPAPFLALSLGVLPLMRRRRSTGARSQASKR